MFGQHLGNVIFCSLLLQGTRLSAQINTRHLRIKLFEILFFKRLLHFYPFPAFVRYSALLARILPITYQRKDSPAHSNSFRARPSSLRGSGRRYYFGSKQLAFVFLPPPCNRGSGIQTESLLIWLPPAPLVRSSATPCGCRHLFFGGRAVGGEKMQMCGGRSKTP